MDAVILVVGATGFAVASVVYAASAMLVFLSRSGTRQGNWLVVALAGSALWACCGLLVILSNGLAFEWIAVVDAFHVSLWIAFLARLIGGDSGDERGNRLAGVGRIAMAGAVLGFGLVLASVLGSLGYAPALASVQLGLLATLSLPVMGALLLEQVFRNSDFDQREVTRPLSLGVGAILAIDLFTYSHAVLIGRVDPNFWVLRGVANAAAAPLIILAAKRQPAWSKDLFVSRQVVFHTTTLIATGLYLLAVSAGGYLIGARDSSWSPTLQLLFLACAITVLLSALFSTGIQNRFKVFIAKHFYRNRYDYREEWLRLIETLAGRASSVSLPERSVKALADIVGASKGELWLSSGTKGRYRGYGALKLPVPVDELSREDALVRFLDSTHWIVDTKEYASNPEKYENFLAVDPHWLRKQRIIVPLLQNDELIGVVALDRPLGLGELTFEDHDLLRTAGKQVAVFLAQELAQNELAENRQFEAFSKLTAFLMHDLKNLVAQQELLVRNTKRFKDRAEFIDDAVATIALGVQRMRKILDVLGNSARREQRSRVSIEEVLQEVASTCSDREPRPRVAPTQGATLVSIDRDRLVNALIHAVRNAQDATPTDGSIDISLDTGEGWVTIEIRDTGEGMDPKFVRDRLFKAFDSTKGVKGMGIGAHQMRESIQEAGGEVIVSSSPGEGTTMSFRLPLLEATGSAGTSVDFGNEAGVSLSEPAGR